ncbi:MAG: glycosyltransferase, partial [Candidatus Tantalella remota]|nr:glycosyltransferase [Candidatus Tantalella remota]
AGMLELMFDADICISAGGQTLYELARVGVPTVCVCFADNQRNNIKGLVDGGFLEYVGDVTDDDIVVKVERGINILENMETRKERSLAGRSLVPGNGAVNIFLKAVEVFGIKE